MHTLDDMTDLDWALMERYNVIGWGFIGPLTKDQQDGVDSYEEYMVEVEREFDAQDKAGGREICPGCGWRTLKFQGDVCTYGVPSNPNSEYTSLSVCEDLRCRWDSITGERRAA
jgi:hypothetical protein